MSSSYGAYAAFGVLLSTDLRATTELLDFEVSVANAGESLRWWESCEDLYVPYDRAVDAVADRINPELRRYNPPLRLIYTGYGEDRPGDCSTDPDCWILGFGLCAFPVAVRHHDDAVRLLERAGADWYTWVE